MKKIIFVVCFLQALSVFPQGEGKTIQSIIDLSLSFDEFSKKDLLSLSDSAIALSKNLSQVNYKAELYYRRAKLYDYYQEYDSSFYYYKKAVPIFNQIHDSLGAAQCYNNIGISYYYYGDYKKSLKSYSEAKHLLESTKEIKLKSLVSNNLGLLYKSMGKYDNAIRSFHNSIDLKEELNDTVAISNSYQNIGVVYWEQRNYKEALISFEKAADMLKNNKSGLADIYNNIGLIYNDKAEKDKALDYYNKALKLYRSQNSKKGIASATLNIAVLKEDNLAEAEKLFTQSLKLFDEIGYEAGVFISKINLGEIFSQTGRVDQAISYTLEAINLDHTEQSKKNLASGYMVLSDSYLRKNNYKKGYYYLNKYLEIYTEIFNLEKNKQINDIRTKYETDKKDARLLIYQQENKIQSLQLDKKSKLINTTIIILSIIVLSLLIIIFLYIQKRKSYKLLVEQNVKLTKAEIKNEEQSKGNTRTTTHKNKKPTRTTLIDDELKKQLIDNLVSLMENDKFYLNSKLTINDYAKELNTNRNYLSQIINEHYQINFNHFVNEYRIKEARKLLINSDYDNYSIDGIAKTVGFHSKGSFNTAFKKFTGVTPSFFKNNS